MATHTLGYAKKIRKWPPLSWSYGSWIYNYLCNHCISPLKLWIWITSRRMYSVQHYLVCDKVCQWLAPGRWFSPVSSTNKTDRHDITENIVESGVKHDDPNPNHKKIGLVWLVESHVLLVLFKFSHISEIRIICLWLEI